MDKDSWLLLLWELRKQLQEFKWLQYMCNRKPAKLD